MPLNNPLGYIRDAPANLLRLGQQFGGAVAQTPLGQSIGAMVPGREGGQALEDVVQPEGFQSAIPSFDDNPLGAIGFVLSETARGIQGQPSRVPELQRQDEMAKENNLRRRILTQEVLDQFVARVEDTTDEEQRANLVTQYQNNFGEALGVDFGQVVTRDPAEVRARLDQIGGINPEFTANMSVADMDALLDDPVRYAAYQEISDRNSLPQAVRAIERAIAVAETDPQARAVLEQVRANGITMSEIEQIAPQIGMQAWEVSALRANQNEIFPQLSNQFGIEFVSTGALQEIEAQQIAARFRPGRAPTALDRVTAALMQQTNPVTGENFTESEATLIGAGIVDMPGQVADDQTQFDQVVAAIENQVNPDTGANFTHDEAILRAADIVRVEVDNQGNVVAINELGERGTEARDVERTGGTAGVPPPTPAEGESMVELAEGTSTNVAGLDVGISGLGGTLVQLWADTGGQVFGISDEDQRFVQGRTMLNQFSESLVRGLVVNPRFPQGEMQRVRDLLNVTTSAGQSTESLIANLRAADRVLRQMLAQAERDARDPTLSNDTQEAQAANAATLRSGVMQIGIAPLSPPAGNETPITPPPSGNTGAASIPGDPSQLEIDTWGSVRTAPSGIAQEIWDEADGLERALLVRAIRDQSGG